ncbi:hypothetical protein [Nonomuraea sp. NPDC005650]|uniref:hypothetical protein n=1 Tax=Nonomuraea sp. NPDC005650 TaxID=3157045 RepID=UPI0033B18F97
MGDNYLTAGVRTRVAGKHSSVKLELRAQRAGQSLARWLAPLTFTDWSAARVTTELTRAVVAWGVAHGWRVRREMPSLAELPGAHPDRSGYLDVVCERLDGPPIAIEIDQTEKPWSARKLLVEADSGVVPVWVRWGEPQSGTVPEPVALVVFVTTCRAVGPTRRRLYSRTADQHLQPSAPPAPATEQPPQHAPTRLRCRATTKKGEPCPIDARPSGLCHVHDPAMQCGRLTRKGSACTVATGGGPCKYHQDQSQSEPAPQLPPWLPDVS